MHLNEKGYSTAKHVRISERDQEILVRLHFAGNQLDFSVHVVPLIDIKSLHLDELRRIAQPSYRGGQIADWLYQKRVTSFAEMTNLPHALRTKLADNLCFGKIEVVRVLGSKDTTRKFLFRLSDNNHRIGPDPGIARALWIALGSSDDLRLDSGRLCLWL